MLFLSLGPGHFPKHVVLPFIFISNSYTGLWGAVAE